MRVGCDWCGVFWKNILRLIHLSVNWKFTMYSKILCKMMKHQMLRVWGRKFKIIFELMRVDSFNKISILNEWGFSDSNMKTGAHIAQDSQPGFPYNYLSHFHLYILVVTLRTFSQQNWLDTDADGHHHIKRGLRVIEWNKYLLILQQSLLFTKQSSIHWKIWEKVVKGNRSFHSSSVIAEKIL